MGKYKKVLVSAAKEEQEKEKEQNRLREKHQVQDSSIVVVEKSNMVKFLIRNAAGLIRTMATILLFVLAALGLMALVYPEIRIELFQVLHRMILEFKTLI